MAMLKFLMVVDETAHWLNRAGLLPDRWQRQVCDRFDLYLGVQPDEL